MKYAYSAPGRGLPLSVTLTGVDGSVDLASPSTIMNVMQINIILLDMFSLAIHNCYIATNLIPTD